MVSATFTSEAFAADSGVVYVVLLTIDHDDLASPIYVAANNEDIVSGGNTFVAFSFDIMLPDNKASAPTSARLSIDNVSMEIATSLRSISTPATVTIQIVDAATPNTVEVEYPQFQLTNVRWDALKVTGDLTQENFTVEPYPAGSFTPNSFPGVI